MPTKADMARNQAEARHEIGRQARQLADRCINGEPVNAAMLHLFGGDGKTYFYAVLQNKMAS